MSILIALFVTALIFICAIWLLYRKIEKLEEKVEELEGPLDKAKDDPLIQLVFADAWIEEVRRGSSEFGMKEDVLPLLRNVCESTNADYWLGEVGLILQTAKVVAEGPHVEKTQEVLEEIDEIKDEYSIDRVTL